MAENTGNFLKGLIIGGLAGAVLGILFAPKSGRETREDIANASDSALKRLKELEAAAEKKVSDLASQGKEVFEGSKDRVKKALDAGVEAYKGGKESAS